MRRFRGGKDKKSDKNDVHRYLFVMARFNKDAVKQPELAKLPDLPAGAEAKAMREVPRMRRRKMPTRAMKERLRRR